MNAIGPAALVWSEDDVCADRYGDGRGAITYVGTCDASPSGRTHTVSLTLDGLCAQDGCDPTNDADPKTIDSATWQNPCPASAPCLLERPCAENADTLVEFNLTFMRDANQGFFDIAVNFEDVFCSAKLDCVPEMLHRPGPNGVRDLTAVLGFACTSGAANTCLYANVLTLDCGGANVWTVNPSQGPGGSYPIIAWERDILKNGSLACSAHPLNVTLDGEAAPAVATDYTELDTPATFAFTNCPAEVDACAGVNPCLNGGSCTNLSGTYSCSCVGGYSGANCEIAPPPPPTPCSPNPCQNDGFCSPNGADYQCICSGDWTGRNCETCAATLCSSRPDYYKNRFLFCINTMGQTQTYCESWMGCQGPIAINESGWTSVNGSYEPLCF